MSAYHEKLAQGIADLVEPNGNEITSVLYYPPAYGESDEELDEETIAEGKLVLAGGEGPALTRARVAASSDAKTAVRQDCSLQCDSCQLVERQSSHAGLEANGIDCSKELF